MWWTWLAVSLSVDTAEAQCSTAWCKRYCCIHCWLSFFCKAGSVITCYVAQLLNVVISDMSAEMHSTSKQVFTNVHMWWTWLAVSLSVDTAEAQCSTAWCKRYCCIHCWLSFFCKAGSVITCYVAQLLNVVISDMSAEMLAQNLAKGKVVLHNFLGQICIMM